MELLERAKSKRIAVIGDAMLDVYLVGDVERISPEAPVPVVRVRERKHALGGAANVAQNVAAIGATCDLVAAVGGDAEGQMLRRMLADGGLLDASLTTVARGTTRKTRIMARSQQLVRVDEEEDGDFLGSEADGVIASASRAVSFADAVVFEDYNKGLLTPAVIQAALQQALHRGIPVIVDPKHRNFFAYRGATVFKPNRRELQSALGEWVDLDHTDALPEAVTRLGIQYLLLTLGENGMLLCGADGEMHRVPAAAREVYDVVGAGDTVTAYLAAMFAAGATPLEAAYIANLAAGIEVGKVGAASVSATEMVEYFAEHIANR